jgi:outer membrane protein OmpA-like peptidoglycan-associated protein
MAKRIPLTLARATAVKDYLIGLGIDRNRLSIEGDGNALPGIDPMSPENRSVHFEVIEPSDVVVR